MRHATKRTQPATFGVARGCRRVGPFLLSETYHQLGMRVRSHEHATANINFVLWGAYGEGLRGSFETHLADTLQYKPAGAEHTNRFDDAPARCLLVEAWPAELAPCLGEDVSGRPVVRREPRLSLLATRIHRLMRECDDVAELVLEELATELFASVVGSVVNTASEGASRAGELLRGTYQQPWSLREVARHVGLHPAHLGRAFRKRHGCAVGEFVRNLRVLHVARGLRHTRAPIAQLAQEAGFADQSHCTRVFARLLGVPPARYRASVRSA